MVFLVTFLIFGRSFRIRVKNKKKRRTKTLYKVEKYMEPYHGSRVIEAELNRVTDMEMHFVSMKIKLLYSKTI